METHSTTKVSCCSIHYYTCASDCIGLAAGDLGLGLAVLGAGLAVDADAGLAMGALQ